MSRATIHVYGLFALLQDRFEGRKERGATAVEYGLLVGLIAIAIIVAVTALGGQLNTLFNNVRIALGGGA